MRLTDSTGKTIRIRTQTNSANNEGLDFITVAIMITSTTHCTNSYEISNDKTSLTNCTSSILIPPTTNYAFSKNEQLDEIIVHRRLGHVLGTKIDQMAKLNIMNDLPKQKSKVYKRQDCPCLKC